MYAGEPYRYCSPTELIWVAGMEPATQIAHSPPPQAAGGNERFSRITIRIQTTEVLLIAITILGDVVVRGIDRAGITAGRADEGIGK